MIEAVKPSLWLHLTEGIRSYWELLGCLAMLAFHKYKDWGKGRPVLLVPGFLTNDLWMSLLHRFLRKSGWTVYGWEQGINLGNVADIPVLSKHLDDIHARHGQPVALVGWSLGGIYARELAKEKPQKVSQLITMGSPFADPDAPNRAVWIFNLFNDYDKIDPVWKAQVPTPAPLRTTALYSKQDGVVAWKACMEAQEDALHQNIRVRSSHFGFPANPRVLRLVLSLLKV